MYTAIIWWITVFMTLFIYIIIFWISVIYFCTKCEKYIKEETYEKIYWIDLFDIKIFLTFAFLVPFNLISFVWLIVFGDFIFNYLT